MIGFDLNEIFNEKNVWFAINFSTTSQNIMKPTSWPLLIEGFPMGTKVVTRCTMVYEISMWQTKQTNIDSPFSFIDRCSSLKILYIMEE